MNLDNDYDNDGNNIVPCPICLDIYCPIKDGGKCPQEDEFVKDMELRANLTTEQYASYRDQLPTRNITPDCICDGCQ